MRSSGFQQDSEGVYIPAQRIGTYVSPLKRIKSYAKDLVSTTCTQETSSVFTTSIVYTLDSHYHVDFTNRHQVCLRPRDPGGRRSDSEEVHRDSSLEEPVSILDVGPFAKIIYFFVVVIVANLERLDHATIKPGAGFPDHPHRGQTTVSYVLGGKMIHEDSKGNEGV